MADVISSLSIIYGCRNSVVGTESRCGFETRLGTYFPCDLDRLKQHPAPCTMVTACFSEVNHLEQRPCSAGWRMGWGSTSASHLRLHRHVMLCPWHSRTYNPTVQFFFVFFLEQQPSADQGLLIHEVSRSHNATYQSVGLLWTSDQLVAETSTWQHTTLTTDRHPCPRWDSNPRSL